MFKKVNRIWTILSESVKQWNADDPFRHGATIAYYAIFSMPGLLIIIIWTAGAVFGQEAVHGQLSNQIQQFLGPSSAKGVEDIIANARLTGDNFWLKMLGVGTLVFGATTLFLQLQKSLNAIWGVKAAPKNGLIKLFSDRATSLGVILVIAFLLLVSLILSAVISLIGTWIEVYFGEMWLVAIRLLNMTLSLCVTTFLFAIMFKMLPDVDIAWESVWVGAVAAAMLFTVGKTLLGIYFFYAEPGSSFGAAGTVILIMLWVNYTSLILFFGASLSNVYARHYGHPVRPSAHAEWVDQHDCGNRTN